MHPILEHHEIRADLTNRIHHARRANAFIVGSTTALDIDAVTAAWTANLSNAEFGDMMAQRLRDVLIPPCELAWADFWATPLGRAIGWWTGGPETFDGPYPRPIAAAILGVSRQRVAELAGQGALDPMHGTVNVSPTGVRAAGVVNFMRGRYPL